MTTTAYLLIELESGHKKTLHKTIALLPGVKACNRVSGPYDIIAVIEIPDEDSNLGQISESLRNLQGVSRMVTCFILD